MNSYRDETFERAIKFVKNSQKFHPGISNIYVFTSTDEEGNIVDEKYGMNLMTNTGFVAAYQSGSSFNDINLYVGSGTTPVDITDTRIENVCFNGRAASKTNTTIAYNYPMYFASSETAGYGLITLISRFRIFEYPLNIENFPGETRIEEYGMGTAWNNLWTHSRVFSDSGERTSIIKKPNQKLTITVYMCLSLYEHVITDCWADDVYPMITTNAIMFHRMFESSIYTYKRDDVVNRRQTYDAGTDSYHSVDVIEDNVYTNTTTIKSFTLYDGSGSDSGYFDGFMYKMDGFVVVEPAYLTNSETVTATNLISKTPYQYDGFSQKLGTVPSDSANYNKNQYPPITHLISANAYMYDWKTQDWNNQLAVYNPSIRRYSDTSLQSNCGLPIYFWNGREITTAYIYQNIFSNDPILKISGGTLTVYATDSYWDIDTWTIIDNKDNIPQALRSCRYWITTTNLAENNFKFTRASDVFQVLEQGGSTPSDNGFEVFGGFNIEYGVASFCDNYAYHWYMRDNKVYFPNDSYVLTVGNSSDTISMTYGRWLITFNSTNSAIIATDTNNLDVTLITPTTVSLPFTSNVNVYTECYRTESETGIICLQSTKSGVEECVIVDIRGSTVVSHKHDWKMSCCIWGTNKIAYIPTGSDNNIYIYDVTTQSIDGDPIPFPDNVSNITFMFGHSNGSADYVWATNGSTAAFVVNVKTGVTRTPVACTNNFMFTDLHRMVFTSVDDVLIMYKFTEYGSVSNARYVRLDDPTHPLELTGFEFSNNNDPRTRIEYRLRYTYQSTVSGTAHASLMLMITRGYYNYDGSGKEGMQCRVIDFGQYLATGSVPYTHSMHYGSSMCGILMYGENIIWNTRTKSPIINWMPIKLVATTDTPTTMNNIKNVSNKQWKLSYTNRPTFSDGTANSRGIPPGKPLAETDGEGTIIGWSS